MKLGDQAAANRRDQAEQLLQKGNITAAERLLRIVTAANPNDPRAWDLLGTAYFRGGNTNAAIGALRRSLALRPMDADRHYRLAMLLRQVGQTAEASALLRRSLQLRPDFVQARESLDRLQGTPASPASSNRPAVGQKQKAASGPGRLQFEGHRLMRSYLAHVTIAAALALLSVFVVGADVIPTKGVSDYLAGVPAAKAKLATVNSLGENTFSPGARADLQNAQADAAWWESRFDDAAALVAVALMILSGLLLLRAALSSALTRYRVYERRIDVKQGVFRRSVNSVWYYEITDVVYEQPLALLLAGTGRIGFLTDRGKLRITGLAGARKMEALWGEVRDSVLVQRSDIKGVWI